VAQEKSRELQSIPAVENGATTGQVLLQAHIIEFQLGSLSRPAEEVHSVTIRGQEEFQDEAITH